MSALPAALVRALRDPAPTEAEFAPTRFCPASNKAWFAGHYLRFVSSGFPRHQFTTRFYRQLIHTFGHIACYDLHGFWTEFFATGEGRVAFLEQCMSWPCHGSPEHTWCDVERAIIGRLRQVDLLGFHRGVLRRDQERIERAEFARLRAKYEHDVSPVDPGVLRTVLVPAGLRSGGVRAARQGETGQLTLGLG